MLIYVNIARIYKNKLYAIEVVNTDGFSESYRFCEDSIFIVLNLSTKLHNRCWYKDFTERAVLQLIRVVPREFTRP